MFRLITTILLLAAGPLAYGHTALSKSMPADRSTLGHAPTEIVLEFTEAVRLTSLTIVDQAGTRHELGPLPAEASAHFAIAAPATLGQGTHTVAWRALSADTHVVTGEFAFAVGAGGAGTAPAAAADHGSH